MTDVKKRRAKTSDALADGTRRGTEAFYRSLADSMLNGLAYCRMMYDENGHPVDWVYLLVNKAFEKQTGLKNVQGRKVSEVIPGVLESDPGLFDVYHRVVSTGKPERFELRVAALDQWFYVYAYRPVKGHFVALFDVITEYKQTLEALQQSEEKFREIIEISHDIHYRQDIATLDLDYMSPSVERTLGYTPEEIKKMTPVEQEKLFHPEDMPRLRSFANDLIESERRGENHIELHFRMIHKDGSIRWINGHYFLTKDPAGRPEYVVGVLRDFTEHKLSDDALIESEEKYRFLLDESTDPIFAFTSEGQYRYVNNAFAEGVQRSADEIIGKKIWDVFPKEEADKRFAALKGVFVTGEEKVIEVRVPRSDGDRYYITTIKPIKNDQGEVLTAICSSKDITARFRAEKEKSKLESQLRQAQKMESIGRLAGGVAHDFNNLLTGILGYSEILLTGLRDDDPIRADVMEIKNSADRAAALTSQLLAFSRRQVIEPKIVDLNHLLSDLMKMLTRLIGENVEVVYVPLHGLKSIKVDPHQIEQVMVNLVINARDAMPAGGRLTVRTDNGAMDEEFVKTHLGAVPGHYVLLSVSDSGMGMSPEVMEHLFEPFYTTKEKGRGTGLGLSMVYGIVKQNNGFIYVRSVVGNGTTFDVYFPRVEGEIVPIVKTGIETLPAGTETILLVEDEEAVRSLAERILAHQGYRVIPVEHGGQAFHLAENPNQKIDLLLTDVIMPNINGKELFEKIRKIRPGLRVLYMSGYTEEVIAMHGILEEDTDFLQKPFSIDTLVRKVRYVLDS